MGSIRYMKPVNLHRKVLYCLNLDNLEVWNSSIENTNGTPEKCQVPGATQKQKRCSVQLICARTYSYPYTTDFCKKVSSHVEVFERCVHKNSCHRVFRNI